MSLVERITELVVFWGVLIWLASRIPHIVPHEEVDARHREGTASVETYEPHNNEEAA